MVPNQTPGVGNVLADGIPRWSPHTLRVELRRDTGPDWREMNLGRTGRSILDEMFAPRGEESPS